MGLRSRKGKPMTDPIKKYALDISTTRLKDDRLKRIAEESHTRIANIHRLIGKLEEEVDAVENIIQDIEIIAVRR